KSTPHFVLKLRGGVKKRKNKSYTISEKNKHKRKKIKLTVLEYFKVGRNSTINRLCGACPTKCSAVFMASHFGRH
ncbi:unnamed protein product, partial [Gulo gulo]